MKLTDSSTGKEYRLKPFFKNVIEDAEKEKYFGNDFLMFGPEEPYSYNRKYEFPVVVYLPQDILNGFYDIETQYEFPGMYPTVNKGYYGGPKLEISRIFSGSDLIAVSKTYPVEEGNSEIFVPVETDSGTPLLRLRICAPDEDVFLRAFEMGTEKGGLISGIDNFTVYNAETSEFLSKVFVLGVTGGPSSFCDYGVFYLEWPIMIKKGETKELELRGVVEGGIKERGVAVGDDFISGEVIEQLRKEFGAEADAKLGKALYGEARFYFCGIYGITAEKEIFKQKVYVSAGEKIPLSSQ